VQIDHVIYATADLDAASARVEQELGVTVVPGGRHEGIGTHNRIVPLANGYIELLAIADRDEAAASELGRAVQARIDAVGDGLMGWAVRVEDVTPEAERLEIAVSGIAREGLRAQLAGLAEAMREPYLPFFIGRDRPAGSGTGAAIEWIEVAGDAARLREWLGGASDLPVRVVEGPAAVRAVGIARRELR
jgi:hypothetical protein